MIKKIRIQNFEGIADGISLCVGTKCTFLLGGNGQGKTSILDAIRYVLTETVYSGISKKQDLKSALHEGTRGAWVELIGPIKIKRSLTNTTRTGPSPSQVAAQLGIDDIEKISVALNPDVWWYAPDKDKQKLLQRLCNLNMNAEEIKKEFEKESLWQEDIASPVVEEIAVKGWEAGYQLAYQLRREAGQKAKAIASNLPEAQEMIAIGHKEWPIATLVEADNAVPYTTRIQEVDGEVQKVSREIGRFVGRKDVDEEKKKAALQKLQTELSQLPDSPATKILELEKEKASWEEKHKANIKDYEALLEATKIQIEKNKKEWVSPLACPIPDKSHVKRCPAIQPDWSSQEKELDEIEEKIKKEKAKKYPKEDLLGQLKKKEEIKTKMAKMLTPRDKGEKEENLAEISELKKQEQKLKAKKEVYTLAKVAVERWRQVQEIRDNAQKKIKAETDKRANYDRLVKALSPEALPSKVLKRKIGPVQEFFAEAVKKLNLQLSLSDDGLVESVTGRPIWSLSGSEQSRIKMVIAALFAKFSGLGFFLMDEINLSVQEVGRTVQEWLMNSGVQAIVAASSNIKPKIKQLPEGVVAYWVEDGKIESLCSPEK